MTLPFNKHFEMFMHYQHSCFENISQKHPNNSYWNIVSVCNISIKNKENCEHLLHKASDYFWMVSHAFLNTILNGQAAEVTWHNISWNPCLSVTDMRELEARAESMTEYWSRRSGSRPVFRCNTPKGSDATVISMQYCIRFKRIGLYFAYTWTCTR